MVFRWEQRVAGSCSPLPAVALRPVRSAPVVRGRVHVGGAEVFRPEAETVWIRKASADRARRCRVVPIGAYPISQGVRRSMRRLPPRQYSTS
jgi:hypothetical protein